MPKERGIEKMGRCKICNSQATSNSVYCDNHQLAYTNIEEAYTHWRYGLDISWIEYLEKISKLRGTGEWAKEVALDILENI